MKHFSNHLINWYKQHKRELPWRKTTDPYTIWVSEIIMQQTQIITGLPYYNRFMQAFPTITDLAQASINEVLKLWEGMGYYSRARNMHETALFLTNTNNGIFPSDKKEIDKLKGIGPYTSAAIASISFNQPYAVVDGNVYRFLSRLYGISTPIDSSQGKKEFTTLAQSLLANEQPGTFNQAMMEMGALICKKASPQCNDCPFVKNCIAYKNKSIEKFPVKNKSIKQKQRYFIFLIIGDNNQILIEQRNHKDIWQGLYQFPCIETNFIINKTDATNLIISNFVKLPNHISPKLIAEGTYLLTHQKLNILFYQVKILTKELIDFHNNSVFSLISFGDLNKYAFPKPFHLVLKQLKNTF